MPASPALSPARTPMPAMVPAKTPAIISQSRRASAPKLGPASSCQTLVTSDGMTSSAAASAGERLRDLERELGSPLFERQRRGVTPTPAGLSLIHHARLVTQQLETMRGELADFARGLRGRVRLLSNTAATLEVLPARLGA